MSDRKATEVARSRVLAQLLLAVAGGRLRQLGRRGAGALLRAGRRWAAATTQAAKEQLFAASAALEIGEAALAGEPLRDLALRTERLGRSLTGAADAVVFVWSAGALRAPGRKEAEEPLQGLAQAAFAHGRPQELSQPRAQALPLRSGQKVAGVLVLCAASGSRVRHRALAPLLQRAGAALAAAERQASKDRFLSFAAHELKTPLTTIKGYAYSLARRLERGETADPSAIQALERQAERLHGILEEMLEVSRLETGRFVLHLEPCDLRDLLDSAQRTLRRLGNDGVTVPFSSRPLPLSADRDRIERSIVALAQMAGTRGPVELRASASEGQAILRLSWEGASLQEEERRRAFAPAWEDPPQRRQGLGMALSLAEKIAALHGGALRCEPSAFLLELPLREVETQVFATEGSRKVLVVDDDAPLAQMLADLLAENGFAADWAGGGATALERVRGGAVPDLLVLDLRMPDLDGTALLHAVRSLGLAPRVVLLSADRAVAEAARALGAQAFVEKPFAPESLLAAVRRALPAPAPA